MDDKYDRPQYADNDARYQMEEREKNLERLDAEANEYHAASEQF